MTEQGGIEQGGIEQGGIEQAGKFEARYLAFLETISQLRPRLHRYCSRMTGSITDGEDVVQDAIFRAYRSLDTFDDSRPLTPWLFRIAHNQCIDFLRRRGVREEAEAAVAEPDFTDPVELSGPAVGPAIEHLVLNLPPKERACVLLKDVFEYSLDEIAELVDSTVGGVKAALNRGRSKLASSENPPAAPRVATPENKKILQLYVERFNRHDWDGLRELISADARLLVADRFAGRLDAGYFGVYERMRVTWRLTLGEVDGEPSVILLNLREGGWEIEGIVRLDLAADGHIERISDYQHCPWTLTAGSLVVRESVADNP
ncbi:MAG TPA: RNA polymerase sigma factor [Bryobacteraceae bacterium]|jgi:RNA polymerase sigma-70 factor (ECF subfamily)|nr:RNA polymerase sigma factor [Bryobacteraceae bacterium]